MLPNCLTACTVNDNSIHLLHAGEGNMNIYSPKSIRFPEGNAIIFLLYRMKPRKHIHVKYCWQTYFKSIGTLSQTFENHIHCKGRLQVMRASDVFLSKNDSSGGKLREASEWVEYDFYFTEYDFCPV